MSIDIIIRIFGSTRTLWLLREGLCQMYCVARCSVANQSRQTTFLSKNLNNMVSVFQLKHFYHGKLLLWVERISNNQMVDIPTLFKVSLQHLLLVLANTTGNAASHSFHMHMIFYQHEIHWINLAGDVEALLWMRIKNFGILPSELGLFIMPYCLHKFLKNADVISNLGVVVAEEGAKGARVPQLYTKGGRAPPK